MVIVAVLCLFIGFWFFGMVFAKDGFAKNIMLVISLAFFSAGCFLLNGAFGWIGLTIGAFFSLGLMVWMFIGSRTGATIYKAQAKASLASGKSPQEAILNGLQLLITRRPFNELEDDDQQFLAQVFGKLGRPDLLCPFLIEADKKRSVAHLKDRRQILVFATSIKQERERV